MDKNKSELDEFMAGLGGSSESPEEQKAEDPFNHLEEKVEEETSVEEKDEKPLPFNKDPKVQKFIEKEISKRMADFKPTESRQEEKKENDEVVESLIAVIGNDTPEKRRAVEALRDRLDEGTRKITEWENQQQQSEIADKEAEEQLESAFGNIEEKFDVDIMSGKPDSLKRGNGFTYTRQEFVSFVEKIAPKDANGEIVDYPDMNSTWETFSDVKKSTATPSRAKELASRSMRRSAETSSEPVLKRGGQAFRNSDEFIESLSR